MAESDVCAVGGVLCGGVEKQDATQHGQRRCGRGKCGWGNGAPARTGGQWEDRTMRPWGDWEIAIGAV
jgi:hypothetical protein